MDPGFRRDDEDRKPAIFLSMMVRAAALGHWAGAVAVYD
jgi:hypothetical protein